MFNRVTEVGQRSTRQELDFSVLVDHAVGKPAEELSSRGAKVRSGVPPVLKNSSSLKSFRLTYKRTFLECQHNWLPLATVILYVQCCLSITITQTL